MANKVKLEIVTPNKKFFDGPVECVTVRTLDGQESFMARHSWAFKLLDTGLVRIYEKAGGEPQIALVAGGYIDVRESILIFTDAVEWAKDIDVERATKAKATLEDWIASQKSVDGIELEEAKTLLKREIVRMSVGSNRK